MKKKNIFLIVFKGEKLVFLKGKKKTRFFKGKKIITGKKK